MTNKPIIGCLALQGCVERHRPHVEAAGAEFRAVKTAKHFAEVDAFILPGGESTTMLKLIDRFDLWDVLANEFAQKPVWGICAGSILLAEKVLYKTASSPRPAQQALTAGIQKSEPQSGSRMDPVCANASDEACQRDDEMWREQKSFAVLPITVIRNGYGRQLDSHHAVINGYEVSLIRAPVIKDVAKGVEVIASHDGDPVWVRSGKNMATTFHPELTFDFPSPMHKEFVEFIKESNTLKN